MASAEFKYAGDNFGMVPIGDGLPDYLEVDPPPDSRTPGQHAAYHDLNALLRKVYRPSRSARSSITVDDTGPGCLVTAECGPLTDDDAGWGEQDDLANVPRKTHSFREHRGSDVEESIIKAVGRHAMIPLAVSECRIAPNLMEQLKSRDKTKGRLRILDQTETTILTFIRGAPVLVIDDGSLPYNMIVVDSMRSRR